MRDNQDHEAELAADNILLELPNRDRRLAKFLTKQLNDSKYAALTPLERKLTKIQILGALNRTLLQDIVSHIASKHGPSGKTSFSPKSMIAFIERMPNLSGDEINQYQEMVGGNYRNL